MSRAFVIWILAALGGIVLVAGVTIAASSLSTQAIGLSSEPLSAGEDLSPPDDDGADDPAATATPDRAAERRRQARARARARARAQATPAPTAVAPPPVATPDDDELELETEDDSSGRGRGRGRGRSGGDSGSDDD
jgi:hypothetical protein